ncbi:MAG: hypothetical protein ABEJ79_06740 [Halolamina sp.]
MEPVPVETVARRFRALSPPERRAFLAALWAAAGEETTVTDDGVVVRADDPPGDDSEGDLLRVVDPGGGLLGSPTPSIDDADVVVATSADDDLAAAAEAAGATYVPPSALRDRLLYAVDRDRGAALCREHLDCEPVVPEAEAKAGRPAEDDDATVAVRRAAAPVALLILVVGLVAAGSGLPGPNLNSASLPASVSGEETPTLPTGTDPLRGGDDQETTTAAAVASYPAGLSSAGVESARALGASHASLARGSAYRLRLEFAGPPDEPGFQGFRRIQLRATVQSPSRYVVGVRFVPRNESAPATSYSRYANGSEEFVRRDNGSAVTYDRRGRARGPSVTGNVVSLVERYLDTRRSRVRVAGDDAETRLRVRAVDPGGSFDDTVSGYEATATVRESGFVESMRVQYARERDGERFPVRIVFSYLDVGTAETSPPSWYDDAQAATGEGEETETPTGTETTTATNTTTPTGTAG